MACAADVTSAGSPVMARRGSWSWLLPLGIFGVALALRIAWLQGAVLGDDPLEFGFIDDVARRGTDFTGELAYRFPIWIANVVSIRLLGMSEASFFAPTWVCSATFSVIGYGIARAWGIARGPAALIALYVATAPFEVLLGTVRANDIFLAWCLALGLWAVVRLESRPVWQGAAVACCAWLAFYAKVWALYAVPALVAYFIGRGVRARTWSALGAFVGISGALHVVAAVFWKLRAGVWFPFLVWYPPPYPVPASELRYVFERYPRMLFQGSEFGTTLFGWVPYELLALLLVAILLWFVMRRRGEAGPLDRWDGFLMLYWGSWFLFLNFFPTGYRLDQYYAPPHIFRYLAPISFPITLHAAKLVWQLGASARAGRAGVSAFMALLIAINVVQAADAVGPGRTNRRALVAVTDDLKRLDPPKVLADPWLAIFLRRIYLARSSIAYVVEAPNGAFQTAKFEEWVHAVEPELPADSMLITGLGQCVHYQCPDCGLRLSDFVRPLGERWALVREYDLLDYLPRPEPARVWRYLGAANGARADESPLPSLPPDQMFAEAMKHFDRGEYALGGRLFREVRARFPDAPEAGDAQYFAGAAALRGSDWRQAVREFRPLTRDFPASPWVGAAYYNLGLAYRALGNVDDARAALNRALEVLPPGDYLRPHAVGYLEELDRESGWLVRVWKRLRRRPSVPESPSP